MIPYKLTIHNGEVIAIREEDLPRKDIPYRTGGYDKALSAALSEKGVKVTNVIGVFACADGNPALLYAIGKNIEGGYCEIRMAPGALYDVPEGFELEVECPCDRQPGMMCFACTGKVAVLVPKEQPKEDDQDKLWDQAEDVIAFALVHDDYKIAQRIVLALKAEGFTITRNP